MADGRVVIDIDLDARDMKRGAAVASNSLRQVDRSAKKTEGNIGKLKKVIAGWISVQALRQLATYSQRLFELGSTAEETASKFATVFGPAAQGLDRRLREVANTMGITQTEARTLTSSVGALTQTLGFTEEEAADLSFQMLTLSADVTSLNNVSGGTERVLNAVKSALLGENEALKGVDLSLKAAMVTERQAQRAAEGHADAMTEKGKVYAILDVLTRQAGKANDDLNRTQDSLANTSRRVQAELREQEERFARLNTVTFNYVTQTVAELLEANEETGESFGVRVARAILEATGRFVQLISTVGNTIKAFVTLGSTVRKVAGDSGSSFSFFALQMNFILGALTKLQQGLLIGAKAVAFFRLQWAEFKNRPKSEIEAIRLELKQLDDGLKEASNSLERMGSQFAGGLGFLPSGTMTMPEGFDDWTAAFENLNDTLGDLPSVEGIIAELNAELENGITNGTARQSKARQAANDQAEKDRRDAVDAEFAARELTISAMREGTDKEVQEIDLAFDRKREAYRRGYGMLTAEETRLFEQAQDAAVRVVRQVEVPGQVQGRALQTGESALPIAVPDTDLQAERARIKAFQDEIRSILRDVEQGTLDTTQGIAGKVLGGVANALSQIPPALLSSTAQIFGALESLVGTQMNALRDRTSDQVAGIQDRLNALPQSAVSQRAALQAEIAAIEEEAYEREKEMLARKKRLATIQAIIGTAAGVADALRTGGPFPLNLIAAAAVGAAGAAQIAAINSETIAPPRARSGGSGGGAVSRGNSTIAANIATGPASLNASRGRQAQAPTVNVNNQAPNITVNSELKVDGQVLARTVSESNRARQRRRGTTGL